MDHAQFKAKQTAAVYVADGLDELTLEAFETHMMGCTECVEEVETWRAIKLNMPRRMTRAARAPAAAGRTSAQAAIGWRMAASLIMGGVIGAASGWFGHDSTVPNLDSSQTALFNVPAATRGGDCTSLRFAPVTKFAVVRVPGVARDRKVVATDAEKHELPASRYSSRLQADGSHLLRIDTQLLEGREVFLEAHAADGLAEPLGCITGEVVSSR
jgi:anti-sigma factor RsiW